MWQQILVFGLFFGVIAYFAYHWFFKRKDKEAGHCSKCEYNQEKV